MSEVFQGEIHNHDTGAYVEIAVECEYIPREPDVGVYESGYGIEGVYVLTPIGYCPLDVSDDVYSQLEESINVDGDPMAWVQVTKCFRCDDPAHVDDICAKCFKEIDPDGFAEWVEELQGESA